MVAPEAEPEGLAELTGVILFRESKRVECEDVDAYDVVVS